MLIKIIKNKTGLTLVETTIALGIIMIGVVASLVLMLASFNSVQESEQEIVVVNLAREGIEIVRALRNDDVLFSGGYVGNFIVDSRDYFDLSTNADSSNIDNCNNCQLYLDNNRYLHTGSAPTIFKRMITIEEVSANAEKRIISEVSWTAKGKTHNFKLETHLTNWMDPDAASLFN